MKTLTYFMLATICIVMCACRKASNTGYTPPLSIYLELMDKNGNSLIKNLKDSVKVSYMQDGLIKYHNLTVEKLHVAYNDTTQVKYYNGLIIDDENFMTDLSAYNVNPIRNFTMYLNGVAMGNIYLDYRNALDDPSVLTGTKFVTFNNIPCKIDGLKYFAPGIGTFLLPTQ